MAISVQTAISLAQTLSETSKISELFQAAKDIFDQNNSGCDVFPLSQQDINFQIILEELNLTQRERDVIYITTFFHSAYTTLNISWYICKDIISDVDKERILQCHACLIRLGLDENLLLCDALKGTFKDILRAL